MPKPSITGDDAEALAGVLAGEHNGRSLPKSDKALRRLWAERCPARVRCTQADINEIRAAASRLGLVG